MIVSAAVLIRERGARATSIDDVLEHSAAPRGSVYHHFPGGRDELLREATEFAGAYISGRIERAGELGPLGVIDALAASYRRELESGGFRAGCPVAAVAIEAREDGDETLQETAAAVFAEWLDLLAEQLEEAGLPAARARRLAMVAVAGIEGALVLAQAQRDTAPLDDVMAEIRDLIHSELAALP